jgi:hypothetical protein
MTREELSDELHAAQPQPDDVIYIERRGEAFAWACTGGDTTAHTWNLGEPLGLPAWIGIAALAGGVLLLSARGGRDLARVDRHATALALFTATTICAYSLVDGVGARLAGSAHAYTASLFIGNAVALAGYGVARRGRKALPALAAHWKIGLAGGTLLVAAAYELTPLKDLCLAKCRSPLGYLMGSWRSGRAGALRMGAGHGAWCLGCCWALMAALFALGVMSLVWTAVVAAVIALEKTLPYKRVATWGVAAFLVGLAIGVMAFPHDVPGLTVPDSSDAMKAMDSMQMTP